MNSKGINYGLHRQSPQIKRDIFLYPHDTDNFVLIVSKRFKSRTDYSNLLESPLIFVWGPITIVATLTRFFFNKVVKANKGLKDTFFQTFGLSLGVTFNAAVATAAENVFLWWFGLGTMLSGTLLSSSMLQGFALGTDSPAINNLKELAMSGLVVHSPNYIDSVKYFFENNPEELKFVSTVEYVVTEMISRQNMSNAYIIREGKYNTFLTKVEPVSLTTYTYLSEHIQNFT